MSDHQSPMFTIPEAGYYAITAEYRGTCGRWSYVEVVKGSSADDPDAELIDLYVTGDATQ